jgi:hypothetical protein
VVDVASRYKEAEPLTSKEASGVAKALEKIYKRSPLTYPKHLLQVDPGTEFKGEVSRLMAKHKVTIRRGIKDIHRDQGIVESFNKTLAERLFGHQYAQEMRQFDRSTEWVKRLPAVVSALNNEVTRLIGKKPIDAIKTKSVTQSPASPTYRPVGHEEKKLNANAIVRYLYQPGELEGGKRRATDPVWSIKIYRLGNVITKPETPVIYYLLDGPKTGPCKRRITDCTE